MRGLLLNPDTMRSLVEAGNIQKFSELLYKTPYKEDFKKLSQTKIDAATLENIFYQKFIDRVDHITRVAPENMASFFRAHYFMKLEIQNLKRIFRGKFSNTLVDRIKRVLLPAPPGSIINFDRLAEADTLETCVHLLGNTIYAPIKETLSLCKAYDALWPMETKLNNIYVNVTLDSVAKIPSGNKEKLKRIIEAETDVENLLLAIAWRKSTKKPPRLEDVFQLTYKISKKEIERIIAGKDLTEAIKSLASPYNEIAEPITYDDEALVRTRLRKHICKETLRDTLIDDFGFSCIMSYLILCEIEKDDLSTIAWGLENNVRAEKILRYLATTS